STALMTITQIFGRASGRAITFSRGIALCRHLPLQTSAASGQWRLREPTVEPEVRPEHRLEAQVTSHPSRPPLVPGTGPRCIVWQGSFLSLYDRHQHVQLQR